MYQYQKYHNTFIKYSNKNDYQLPFKYLPSIKEFKRINDKFETPNNKYMLFWIIIINKIKNSNLKQYTKDRYIKLYSSHFKQHQLNLIWMELMKTIFHPPIRITSFYDTINE